MNGINEIKVTVAKSRKVQVKNFEPEEIVVSMTITYDETLTPIDEKVEAFLSSESKNIETAFNEVLNNNVQAFVREQTRNVLEGTWKSPR